MRDNVVIGFLGTQLDRGKKKGWRPSFSLTQFEEFPVERLELLYDRQYSRLAHSLKQEVEASSSETEVLLHQLNSNNPWDFEEVYGSLFDFSRTYGFDEDRENYFVHLTTGTHVAQICWFLLTESRHVPARLVQTSPGREDHAKGRFEVVDLDLSKYDNLQQRFDRVLDEHTELLKGGIATRNEEFNAMIDSIETVSTTSDANILLLGATGTGKSELATRIYELKRQNRKVKGRFIHVNCSTLRGDQAMSTLFGHRKAAISRTGNDRKGLLREADGGVLFLDEIDELGLDEQAMILHAIETGKFYPLGSDHEISSNFQLIAGANQNLAQLVSDGKFRADLFARLNLWTFNLPSLSDRREDIEPNITYELENAEQELGNRVGFNANAFEKYLRFAKDPASTWPGNFRDLSASIRRLSTLAPRGRITIQMVEQEVDKLTAQWRSFEKDTDFTLLHEYVGDEVEAIDPFNQVQLAKVIRTCQKSSSLSAAGRTLFSASRSTKASKNDADRLSKYLAKYSLSWDDFAR